MTKTCPALILAGGLGTRLRSVDPTRPKPMVLIKGKPFLYWLILHLTRVGFESFILSTGFKAEQIGDHPWSKEFPQCQFSFHREAQPLGTGGAVQAVFKTTPSLDAAWVVNGDTLLANPLPPQIKKDEVHYVALAANELFDAKPNLHVEGDRVVQLSEGGTLFDGGQVYVTRKAVENYHGKIPCSLHQLIQTSMTQKKVGYALAQGTCYDIGTPERLLRFEKYLEQNSSLK